MSAAIAQGHVNVDIGGRFRLDDIVEAHVAAEERRFGGALLIAP